MKIPVFQGKNPKVLRFRFHEFCLISHFWKISIPWLMSFSNMSWTGVRKNHSGNFLPFFKASRTSVSLIFCIFLYFCLKDEDCEDDWVAENGCDWEGKDCAYLAGKYSWFYGEKYCDLQYEDLCSYLPRSISSKYIKETCRYSCYGHKMGECIRNGKWNMCCKYKWKSWASLEGS